MAVVAGHGSAYKGDGPPACLFLARTDVCAHRELFMTIVVKSNQTTSANAHQHRRDTDQALNQGLQGFHGHLEHPDLGLESCVWLGITTANYEQASTVGWLAITSSGGEN